MISIIIPVYNVEKYIEQCLESVSYQSYRDLEIILVYDKSSDNSYAHCLEWSERDKRFRIIVNSNRNGLGAARNIGLLEASGEYVLFLDSDDWLEKQCIETLYNAILTSRSEYVSSSSYYEVSNQNSKIRHGLPEGIYRSDEMKELLLCGDFVTSWKKLYRRKWLIKNQLMQPELFHYEDWGLFPVLVASAKEITVSAAPGVNYRLQRDGCLTSDNEIFVLQDFERTMNYMFEHFERADNNRRLGNSLSYYCWRDFYTRYYLNIQDRTDDARKMFEHIRKDILVPRFGEYNPVSFDYLVFGSFSLRWEVQRGCIDEAKVDKHYCFSSLISLCSDKCNLNVLHENEFRQFQICQEFNSELLSAIKNADEKTLLLLDFLEERFDILEIEHKVYITESSALRESSLKDTKYVRRIKSGSHEHFELWKNACKKFVGILKEHMELERIILVKNRMADSYGNFIKTDSYDNCAEINHVNRMLERMEDYFISELPGIAIIEEDAKYIFTDNMFRLGCYPEYLNNAWYTKVGREIFERTLV